MVNFLEEPLLNYAATKISLELYLGSIDDITSQNSYFVSPINCPDSILKKFPRTRIVVGDKDPLHDDSILFLMSMGR